MAITIVHKTIVDGVTSATPFTLAAPTTAGNSLIVAISLNDQGASVAAITTNAGDAVQGLPFDTDTNGAFNPAGIELTTGIFWIPKCAGGATTMTITASVSFDAWVYEVSSFGLAVDVATFRDSQVGGNGAIATGPALVATGASDFYVACMTIGQATGVNAPWVFDPVTPGVPGPFTFVFGGAHYIGSGTQTPVFTQTSNNKWSVSGVAFKELPVSSFNLQKLVLTVKESNIPARGRNQ